MDAKAMEFYTENDYYNLPENVRAELINGQFYDMAAPSRIHQKISGTIYRIIGNYINDRHGSFDVYAAPFAVKLFDDSKTIVEPDISVIRDKDKLTDRGCTGAPDWIVEIVSPGNPGHDYVKKLNLYLDAGVREYWIIDPQQRTVLLYFFEENFKVRQYTFDDTIPVNIYDDLSVDFSSFDL